MSVTWTVYLVHLESPLLPGRNRHYLGKTKNLSSRIAAHRGINPQDKGSVFLREANKRAIKWWVVRTEQDEEGTLERRWKKQRNLPRYCPQCLNPTVRIEIEVKTYGKTSKHDQRQQADPECGRVYAEDRWEDIPF